MEATSARTAQAKTPELPPLCPICGSGMVVHALWQADAVEALYWACRRAPVCYGTAHVRYPDTIVPVEHDASSQAIFAWEHTREAREAGNPVVGGLKGLLGRMAAKPAPTLNADVEADLQPKLGLESLIDYGFVIMGNRRLSAARALLDYVLIGPPGIFVVEVKEWPGEVVASGDTIFVDGRERVGALDDVVRAAAALNDTLNYELKPLGAGVRAAALFDRASDRMFSGTVGKVLVGGNRELPKAIRAAGPEALGPETVVRLSLAADRLLE